MQRILLQEVCGRTDKEAGGGAEFGDAKRIRARSDVGDGSEDRVLSWIIVVSLSRHHSPSSTLLGTFCNLVQYNTSTTRAIASIAARHRT